MKTTFLTFLLFFFLINANGQKTTFSAVLNSGLFSFAGRSAEKKTSINYSDYNKTGYTNNPYGSKAGLCYGLSGNLKRITKHNFVWGVDVGFEVLRSKISINKIDGNNATGTYHYDANGRTFLNYTFININPFFGYRLPVKEISLDIVGGFDIGYSVTITEHIKATASNGTTYKFTNDREDKTGDLRPRIQVSAGYKKYGLYMGYSIGTINFMSGYIGGSPECYSKIFRFGMSYTFTK